MEKGKTKHRVVNWNIRPMTNCRNWMVHFDSVTILINTCNKISSIVRFFASLCSRLVIKRILEFLQSIKMLLTLPVQDSQETFEELFKILNQKCQCNRHIPWEPKKLSSETGPPQLIEGKVIEKLTRLTLKIINL